MGYKVAVASSDGVHIDLHFGQADCFAIYQVNEDGSYDMLGQRNTHRTDDSIESIADCRCVLCVKCGTGTETELGKRHITVFMIEKRIDEALEKIIRYYKSYSMLVSFKHQKGTYPQI